jgi:hypothetical protein
MKTANSRVEFVGVGANGTSLYRVFGCDGRKVTTGPNRRFLFDRTTAFRLAKAEDDARADAAEAAAAATDAHWPAPTTGGYRSRSAT